MSLNQFSRTSRPVEIGTHLRATWLGRVAAAHKDDPVLIAACTLQSDYVDHWDKVAKVNDNKDPTITPVRFKRDLQELAEAGLKQLAKRGDAIAQNIRDRRGELSRQMIDKIYLKNYSHGPELRGILRQMSNQKRGDTIKKAITDHDYFLLAAAFDCHPLASGLTEELRHQYWSMAVQEFCPDLQELDETLRDAARMLTDAFVTSNSIISQIGPSRQELDQIEKANQARANLTN